MVADASIYGAVMPQPRSMIDYLDAADQREQRKSMNALQLAAAQRANDLAGIELEGKRDAARQAIDRQNALRAILTDPSLTTPQAREDRALSNPLTMDAGMSMQKARLDNAHLQAQTNKEVAAAGKTADDAAAAKQVRALQQMMAFQAPADAQAHLNAAAAAGQVPMQHATMLLRAMPQDAAGFADWKRNMALGIIDPQHLKDWLLPKFETRNLGSTTDTVALDPLTGRARTVASAANTLSPDASARLAFEQRKDAADRADPPGGSYDWKQDADGRWVALPKKIDPRAGTVAPIYAEAPGKKELQARNVLPILDDAQKLLDDRNTTSSGLGNAVDAAGGFFGVATDGAKNSSKLRVLQGQLMMAMPRMEGPQSDKDVALYKEMAGQIGDPSTPAATRNAALQTIREVYQRYAHLNGGAGQGAPSRGWQPAASREAAIAEARSALLKRPDKKAEILARLQEAGINDHGLR